jgi:hypothetical protein
MNAKQIEKIKSRLLKQHGNTVILVKILDKNFKKAVFKDVIYGEWMSSIQGVSEHGTRHPKRAYEERRKNSLKNTQKKLEKKFGGAVVLDATTYKTTQKQCRFVDKKYGEFYAIPYNVLIGYGHKKRGDISRREKTAYTKDNIQEILNIKHSGNVTLTGNYRGMLKKHKFIDKDYGEFEALLANVVHKGTGHIKRAVKRRQETSLEKYGTNHPMQTIEISTRCMSSNVKTVVKRHWKTKKYIKCVGSYEVKVVDWLNKHKINYLWHPQSFGLPNGSYYIPDLYLEDKKIWVEIKGYFREGSKKKWRWFRKQYPTAELWNKTKLTSMGIL